MNTRILFLGETVGKPGMTAIKKGLSDLKTTEKIDFTVANGEGLSNGFGIGNAHAVQLLRTGVDLITTGEKTYYKKDMVESISKLSRLIRPANFPAGNPGRGFKVLKVGELSVGFINLLGTAGFNRISVTNPFIHINSLVSKLSQESDALILQFHASTTAEESTMAFHLDGKVAAVIGTHSKVLTSDARILPKGTAFITDNGMCGAAEGVGGFAVEPEIKRFIDQIPSRSVNGSGALELQGVVVELDEKGTCVSIETIKHRIQGGTE